MQVDLIRLEDFRNYRFQALELGPGFHIFEGGNAQGKTALLEAVYLGATGRSFRTHREGELIRWEQPGGGLQLQLRRDSGALRQLGLRWQAQPLRRQILVQGTVVRRLGDFLPELPLALFTPDDLELVQGGPELRRGYLDLLLCKLYPQYLTALGRYQKVLRQKSALLRSAWPAGSELDSWDALLVSCGCSVIEFRQQLCQGLAPLLGDLYGQLSGESLNLTASYRPQVEAQQLQQVLQSQRGEELRRRTPLIGPHRDELQLELGGRLLRRFGSQGQRRSLALALRLAQAEILQRIGKELPVILLDDCFSELDPNRQARLLEWLQSASQVLITTATPLPLGFEHCLWRVERGQVFSCSV